MAYLGDRGSFMIRRLLAVALVLCTVASVRIDATAASCHLETVTHALNGFIYVGSVEVCTSDVAQTTSTTSDVPPTNSGLDSICVATAMSIGRDPFEFCAEPEDGTPVEVTPGMVAA